MTGFSPGAPSRHGDGAAMTDRSSRIGPDAARDGTKRGNCDELRRCN